jgi:sugar phosphate isomerase/epimerase
LDRIYGWAAEAGYDGVEIMMDDRWDTHQDAYLDHLADKHGIPILALHPPLRGVWRLDPGDTLVRAARLAARIGGGEAEVVVPAHPPPPDARCRGGARGRSRRLAVLASRSPWRTCRGGAAGSSASGARAATSPSTWRTSATSPSTPATSARAV